MLIESLADLEPCAIRGIIINYNTKSVATLALLSALRYLNIPIVLIDCQSTDGSGEHFRQLMTKYDFDLASAPLKNHGHTLDMIFQTIRADYLLLIDSDIEILNATAFQHMQQKITETQAFGAGFTHGGEWMHAHNQPFGFYVKRMWIPFCLLHVARVKQALQNGATFFPKTIYNEFPASRFLSRMLIKRFRVPIVKKFRFGWLDLFRKEYFGHKPAFVVYDTGAVLHQYLLEQGQTFAELDWTLNEASLIHFHGVTRLILNARDHHGTSLSTIDQTVKDHLAESYDTVID